MMDGVAIKRHSILAGIGGIAGIAAFWRCRKSHTLYIVLPKVHLGKRQKRISRKPVRAKRVFHPRTLGDLKVKGDGKARSTKASGRGSVLAARDSPPHGQRGRCPSRVAKFCAKLTGRRFAALEPSGAAGWAVKMLHGTHGNRHGISPHKAADCEAITSRPVADRCGERVPIEGRAPKTPSRPSPCGAPRARVVPEP